MKHEIIFIKNDRPSSFLQQCFHEWVALGTCQSIVCIIFHQFSWKVLHKPMFIILRLIYETKTTMRVCLTSFLIKILQNLSTGRFHCISFLSIEADRNVDTCYLFNGWNSDNLSMYTLYTTLTNIRSTRKLWHPLKKIMHVKLRSKANVSLLNYSCVSHY